MPENVGHLHAFVVFDHLLDCYFDCGISPSTTLKLWEVYFEFSEEFFPLTYQSRRCSGPRQGSSSLWPPFAPFLAIGGNPSATAAHHGRAIHRTSSGSPEIIQD